MFKRRKRLSRAAFPEALRRGRRVASRHFSAVVPEHMEGYAVVVTKKSFRRSTARHRVKRRVLAALQSIALPPAAIVFPRAGAADLSYDELRQELKELLA